jgi:hypothetical protein
MDPVKNGRCGAVARRGVLRCLLLVMVLCAGGQPVLARDDDAEAAEQRIKAAFLYKFGSYVDWPDNTFEAPDSPFVIGVMGAGDVARDLGEMVIGRTVAGREIEVRRVDPGDALVGIQILFIGHAVSEQIDAILANAAGLPLLTVTEEENVPAPGSIINFVVVGNKVRFDVALTAARLGRLKISARLLAVARNVIDDGGA